METLLSAIIYFRSNEQFFIRKNLDRQKNESETFENASIFARILSNKIKYFYVNLKSCPVLLITIYVS